MNYIRVCLFIIAPVNYIIKRKAMKKHGQMTVLF